MWLDLEKRDPATRPSTPSNWQALRPTSEGAIRDTLDHASLIVAPSPYPRVRSRCQQRMRVGGCEVTRPDWGHRRSTQAWAWVGQPSVTLSFSLAGQLGHKNQRIMCPPLGEMEHIVHARELRHHVHPFWKAELPSAGYKKRGWGSTRSPLTPVTLAVVFFLSSCLLLPCLFASQCSFLFFLPRWRVFRSVPWTLLGWRSSTRWVHPLGHARWQCIEAAS